MSILLESTDGKEFELALLIDRLPESQDGFGDDETATVSFRVQTNDDEWEETSPSVNLHELHTLAEWLEGVAMQTPGFGEIDLLAPELNFQVLRQHPDEVTVRVRFHLADRPPEMAVDADTTEASRVDLKLSPRSMQAAAAQLRSELAELVGSDKDDTDASTPPSMIRPADPDLALINDEKPYPPGAGEGEDNAGNS